jgi:hypothetical protein
MGGFSVVMWLFTRGYWKDLESMAFLMIYNDFFSGVDLVIPKTPLTYPIGHSEWYTSTKYHGTSEVRIG